MTAPILWEPDPDLLREAALTRYTQWLEAERGVRAHDYAELWAWSVENVEAFWESIWAYFDVAAEPGGRVLSSHAMPGAEWFPRPASRTPHTSSATGETKISRSSTPRSCARRPS